jgi:hypothetical protein
VSFVTLFPQLLLQDKCVLFWDSTKVIYSAGLLAPKKQMRIDGMAAGSTTSPFTMPAVAAAQSACIGASRRRRISPDAGRALEILGHAIEYLSDEYVHRGGTFSAHDGQVEAIQTLMGINREIYFGCPEAPSMLDRWRSLLGLSAA